MEREIEEDKPSKCIGHRKSEERRCETDHISSIICLQAIIQVRTEVLSHDCYIDQNAASEFYQSLYDLPHSKLMVERVRELETKSRKNVEMNQFPKRDVFRVFQNFLSYTFSQPEVIRKIFEGLNSLFVDVISLIDVISDVIEHVVVRDELEPNDAYIEDIHAVEQRMSINYDHKDYW
jgi:hypothetical protein